MVTKVYKKNRFFGAKFSKNILKKLKNYKLRKIFKHFLILWDLLDFLKQFLINFFILKDNFAILRY